MRRTVGFVAIAALLATAVQSAVASTVVGKRGARTVVVTQTVSSPAAGAVSRTTIDVGTIAHTNGSMALAKGGMRLGSAVPFPSLSTTDFAAQTKTVCPAYRTRPRSIDEPASELEDDAACRTVPIAESDIQSIFDSAAESATAAIGASLRQIMGEHGATTGIFTFEQELASTAVAGRRRLVWSLVVDASGRAIYGKSKVVRATSSYLYVTYTPLRVTAGLPQSWAYPNAGTLVWLLVDKNMRALSAPTTIDTGGYFDEPEGETGGEAQVKCLMDKASAVCPSPFPDVRGLLDQTGASGAFVDFVHRVTPVYDNLPVSGGEVVSRARRQMDIYQRYVTTSFDLLCLTRTYTYTNAGRYRFELSKALTRYYLDMGQKAYQAVTTMKSNAASPWEEYGGSLVVDDPGAMPDLYIEPQEGGPLLSVALLSASSTVAEVNYVPEPVCVPPPPTPATPAATPATALASGPRP